MGNEILRQTLQAWTQGCDARQARIAVFEHVRDIPYAYPASCDPTEVLAQKRGACSGKHYLLGALFGLLGLKVRQVICRHRFNESLIMFPGPMQDMLRRNEIVDFHGHVQIWVDEAWADVDATWERGLREFGFPVTEEWDGRSAMTLTVVPEETIVAETDPERLKEEMLSKLTQRQRMLRKQFLEALNAWVEELGGERQLDADGS